MRIHLVSGGVAAFALCAIAAHAQTNVEVATYHGELGVSLTLDEMCHVMKRQEAEIIPREWNATLKFMGSIPDIRERATFMGRSLEVEHSLENTPCRNARKVIDDTLAQVA